MRRTTALLRRRPPQPDSGGERTPDGSNGGPVGTPAVTTGVTTFTSDGAGDSMPLLLTEALKGFGALLANVTVLTALLVYFGWVRAEVHAAQLGIDESLLGMTAREYTLRSVGSVVLLALGVCASGLLWLAAEPHLRRALRPEPETGGRWWRTALLTVLALGWLVLPLLARLLGELRPVLATILFPASVGAGVLLWSWTRSVRGAPSATSAAGRTMTAVLTWLLVVVCLFWTATNYAQDSGRKLAADFPETLHRRPAVVVHSTVQLHLDGPGVVEQVVPGEGSNTYRYDGLRFVEHTGGNYFLVSDGWSPDYGVFFLLASDSPTTRYEFVRGGP